MKDGIRTVEVPTKRISEYRNHEPIPSADIISEAEAVLQAAELQLSLNAVIESMIIGIATTGRKIPTSAVDTMAVTVGADGFVMLLFNPEFVTKIGPEGAAFVLGHEADHLRCRHLYSDPELRKDERWTMATEATINYRMTQLFQSQLPVDKETNEPTGVDPKKVWERYRDDLKKQTKEFLPFNKFIEVDLVCYTELCRMTKPPKVKGQGTCVHGQPPSGGGGQGQGQGQGDSDFPLDDEEVDRLMEEVLNAAVTIAKREGGNKSLREELLELEKRTQGSEKAEKTWGNLGLGALRGEAVETRKVNYWQQWLRNIMAEKLEEGMKLKLLKKIWWTPEPFLAWRGDEYIKSGVIAVDTSGSMYQEVLDFITRQVGEEDNLRMEWWNFDTCLYPIEADKPFHGGGGTSFQPIVDYVNEMEEPPDFVLVVTDGYAPPVTPRDPDRWIWLIVDNPGGQPGDEWPDKHEPRMDCRRVTAESMKSLGH